MKAPTDDPPLHRSGEPEQATLYEALGGVLQRMVVRMFAVSQETAEALVRDTFHSYYQMKVARSDTQAWLTGMVCRNAKEYLQRRGVVVPGNGTEQEREIRSLLSDRDALAMLPSHARDALRLRFEKQKTYPEIAAELDVSVDTAQRLVRKAMAKLLKVIRER
jgi:RNA polymerase sigma factor (sigma-70 family)